MSAPRQIYAYKTTAQSVQYVMDKLGQIDDGQYVDADFISSEDVALFCKVIGFKQSWAGKTLDQITRKGTKDEHKPKFGPPVVIAEEARIVLGLLKDMVSEGRFTSRDGAPFDKTVLNDFLPKAKAGFEGAPTLGHFWEFQYALAVELEHGRTHGTNVTNNHPVLTGLIVMAHLTEDTLYYARLWPMETEGELFKAVLDKKKPGEIADIAEEWTRARQYLAKRLVEKAGEDIEVPE